MLQIGGQDGGEVDGRSLGNVYLELHSLEMQGDWENHLEGSPPEGTRVQKVLWGVM